MNEAKATVLEQIAEKKGLRTEEIGRLDAFSRRVAFAESKGDPKAEQTSGGPGRGLYQHEEGESTEALQQRVTNYEKTYGVIPLSKEDRKALEDGKVTDMSADAQTAVTLAGWVMKTPGDEVGELARGDYKMGQFWLDYHWAGEEEDAPAKKEQWVREMEDYRRMHGGAN
jgi:hypothetical protein